MNKSMIKNKKIFTNNILDEKITFNFLVIICLVFLAIILSPKTLQNDTFYTIKCGEYIFQNGIGNLTSDEFSWLDLPYCYPHWLYDLGMYIIYAKTGMLGIYLSTIIFTTILGLALYKLSLYVSKNRIVSFVVTLLALYLISPYIAARAQLVTFILFSLEILYIEKFLDTKKLRYGFALILIAGFIAQLHVAVFSMFFIFTLPYFSEYIMALVLSLNFEEIFLKPLFKLVIKFSKKEEKVKEYKKKLNKLEQNVKVQKNKKENSLKNPYKVKIEKNKNIPYLVIIIGIALLTGFLNPTGFTAYTYLYKTYIGNTTSSINEHLPLVLANCSDFAIAIIIFLLLLTFMDSKIKLRDLVMLIGVTSLAILSKRQITMFTIAGTPILVKLISDFFEKYDPKTCDKILKFATSIMGFIIIVGIFTIYGVKYEKKRLHEDYINQNDYPVAAANWIKENLDLTTLKLYNEYNYGSYLLYQGIPVFIDSRADLYAPEFNSKKGYNQSGCDIFSDALAVPSLSKGYESIFKKYDVNHVILYSNAKLCLLLEKDENYKLLYKDERFKVYERLNSQIDE